MAIDVMGSMIRMPVGDTGTIKFVADEGALSTEDKGVFTIARRDGTPILRQILPPDLEANTYHMALAYEDTAKLKPDAYEWSFAVVRGGTFDASGKLVSVKGKHTAVLAGKLNIMPVAGGGAR